MLGLIFEATPSCNLDCRYCYNVWKETQGPPVSLTTAQVIALLEGAVTASGAGWLAFSGGEPLMRQDLEEIISSLHQRLPFLLLGLGTNGVLLDRSRCRLLIEAGVDYFEVSLPAFRPERFAALTGRDLVRQVKQNALFVEDAGGILTLSTVLTRIGILDLAELIDFAAAGGADRLLLNRFVPTGEGGKNCANLLPSLGELAEALKLADTKACELGLEIGVSIPVESCILPHDNFPNLKFARCLCGVEKWTIDPAGRLRFCEQSPLLLGALQDHEWESLTGGTTAAAFRSQNRSPGCPACSSWPNCGGGCRFAVAESAGFCRQE